ncbi:hypothetical protein SAMN02745126_05899 [Enhydrobacter aerosaccus]|uniref:Uncharacterized protein n=1 Tax=Enhydrobacter aerosaccus TaxID=225324 RepID=A0A1T4T9P9_9HYPH|nr:hypothetical protein [Enhydrobacter aerosaccus]SKA37166.1 hypothetical protein SAMN02745126_05899 [Enhydrobacter aerosaccus]
MRALMAGGGACLLVLSLPVARGAWEAQKADGIVTDLRLGHPLDLPRVQAGIADLDRAVAADPVAGRYLERSELLGGAGLTYNLAMSKEERTALLRRAEADLRRGLANAPARGIDWLRLAAMIEVLEGASRQVLPPLFLSIDYAPLIPQTWFPRLRIILDCWPYFDDAQKAKITAYLRQNWRAAQDRRFFAWAIHSVADELILRFFLRDEPGAQEEIGKLIKQEMRH